MIRRIFSFGRWQMHIRLLAALVLLGLASCATRMELVAEERDAIRAGRTALVVVRVICSVEGRPWDCFEKLTLASDGPIVAFGLGSFKSVGEPRPAIHRFLSEESRASGWVFFLLDPGTHYLAVEGPLSSVSLRGDLATLLRAAPRWRIDVPDNVKLMYVGTVNLAGHDGGTLMFGAKIINPASGDNAAIVTDESELARRMLSTHVADAAEMKTTLMVRWRPGEPLIIRTPRRGAAK